MTMPRWSERIDLEGGGYMIVCHSGADPRKKCVVCGVKGADRLCDWPMGDGKTCDRVLCRRCAQRPAPVFGKPDMGEVDYCPEHMAMHRLQQREIKADAPGDL